MYKIVKRSFAGILSVMLLITLSGCNEVKEKNEIDNSIYFALAGPTEDIKEMGFQQGMNLALNEINEKGLLNGRKMVIDEYDDQEELTLGIKVAQKIVASKKYTGVIGHFTSGICISTKDTYNDGHVLVMSPLVSNVELTYPTMPYIFRNIASDGTEVETMLAYAKEQGYKNLAVVYRDDDYGRGLSELVNSKCRDYGITVVDSHSDFVNQSEFNAQYDKWVALGAQAVFVGDSMPSATDFISPIREKSQTIPILGSSGFNFGDITNQIGNKYSTKITYLDPYYTDTQNDRYMEFANKYKNAYGTEPEYLSLIAYDTVKLLAEAVEKAGTTNVKKIAATLKEAKVWDTTLGSFHFDEKGNAVGGKLTLVTINQGQYSYQ